MLRKLALLLAGLALTVLGIIGLVLPVIPGIVLLIAAAACFSVASRRLRTLIEQRLHRHPRYRRALSRWQLARNLPTWRRIQLAVWLGLSSLVPERHR